MCLRYRSMPDKTDNSENEGYEHSYEPVGVSYEESRRARFVLNGLMFLSALASSLFLAFVFTRLFPSDGPEPEEIKIPTSEVRGQIALLRGEAEYNGVTLQITLRDLDDAPEYAENLSRQRMEQLAISSPGRLYRIDVHCTSDAGQLEFNATGRIEGTGEGARWALSWPGDVAGDNPSQVGRMLLAQSKVGFTIKGNERRQLLVFAGDNGSKAPAASGLEAGRLDIEGWGEVELRRESEKTAGRSAH